MPGVKSQLKSAIDSISTKSAQAAAARDDANGSAFSKNIAADRAAASHKAVKIKESVVMAREKDLDNILEQLNPPPTKEISSGGKNGGTKTVVDKEEVSRLQKEKTAIMGQLQNAKNDVSDARETAASDTATALEKAGISAEKQAQMATLMSQLNDLNDNLGNGEQVEDDQITDILDKFNEITEGLDREDNQGNLISKAFYNPFKKGLQKTLKYLNDPARPTDPGDTVDNPEGTINHDLEAVGITGQKADDIIAFVERVSDTAQTIQDGEFTTGFAEGSEPRSTAVTLEEMQSLYDDHQTLIQGLTDTQLRSQPLVELEQSVIETIAASGYSHEVDGIIVIDDPINPVGPGTTDDAQEIGDASPVEPDETNTVDEVTTDSSSDSADSSDTEEERVIEEVGSGTAGD